MIQQLDDNLRAKAAPESLICCKSADSSCSCSAGLKFEKGGVFFMYAISRRMSDCVVVSVEIPVVTAPVVVATSPVVVGAAEVVVSSPTQTPLSHVPPLRQVHSELCVDTSTVQLGPVQPARQTCRPSASHV